MERKFKEALAHRRSYYALSNKSLISDEEIENIVKFAVKNIPSAFNSQSTRMVLLLGEQHVKLWNIVKDTLRKIVPAEAFKTTENKIDKSFASGYGTVLFFEERKVVEYRNHSQLIKRNFPYGHNKLLQCINWPCGPCWRMSASVPHYNIITR